ncbi:MAG: tetratricopeptide repeat protein [Ignavibacteria bacterium]|nr:tetratricopeptide repeat protein [Ignavibacteria bacterium]
MVNQRQAGAVFVCLLAAVHVVGFLFPNSLTWGFHALGFLPFLALILYLLCVGVLLFSVNKGYSARVISIASEYMARNPDRFLVITSGVFVIAGVFLHVKAPLLGDGLYLVKNFFEASHGIAPLDLRNEPLSTLYFYGIMKVFEPATFEGFLNAFLIADLLLGIGFIINGFFIVRTLLSDREGRFLAFLFLLVVPYVQLFLGYVETYAALLFTLSLFVLLALRKLLQNRSFLLTVLAFLFMTLTHYSSALLFPSLIYLAYRELKTRGLRRVLIGLGVGILLILLLLMSINFDVANHMARVPHSHFLSWTRPTDQIESYSEAYTFFSLYHAIDLGNFLLLICSSPIMFTVLALLDDWRAIFRTHQTVFLLAAGLPAFLILISLKFDLGAAKDWDVLAPFGVLMALLGITLIWQTTSIDRVKLTTVVVGITLLNTLSFVVMNASTEPSLHRYKALLDVRTMSNLSYYTSTRDLALYFHQQHDSAGPVEAWEQYNHAFPEDVRGYKNIIQNLGSSQVDSIMRVYDRWLQTTPQDSLLRNEYSRFCLKIGNDKFAAGTFDDAARYYSNAVSVDSTYARAYNNLGSVFAQQGKRDTAMKLFQKAIELDSDYSDPYYNLGSVFEELGKRSKALDALRRAAALGNNAAKEHLQQQSK